MISRTLPAHTLWQAARLTLRDGATPFRSFGRISIRPRIYQFVPLLMALRLDPIRLLIGDDVGVGKTIEALLIAREMLDRGEIKRISVLCPPYLCDQWQKELAEKANLEAVVIRSGTVGQLDRRKPASVSIYRHFPIQVTSIDFVKSDRNRHLFLLDCPELVIVDEAHGAAAAVDANANQQQRHRLLREIAAKEDRHLLLLTATPHSGIEPAFRSLLALLRAEFGEWNTGALSEPQRTELARHFVQRTRRDIKEDWEGEDCFPDRAPADRTYRLSPAYRTLFARTYDFCSEIIQSGKELGRWQQRVRYWGALALLRSVMSSPAAAVAALEKRRAGLPVTDEEGVDFAPFVFESANDQTDDEQPTPPLEAAEATLPNTDRRKLQDLERLARSLSGSTGDNKLRECT
jgi:SNF2-related domain